MTRRSQLVASGLFVACLALGGCGGSAYVHRYDAGSQGSVLASDQLGSRLAIAGVTRQVAASERHDAPRVTDASDQPPQ